MARQTSKQATAVISLDDLGRRILARRALLLTVDMPRNTGTRRLPSKRALIKAIEATGARW